MAKIKSDLGKKPRAQAYKDISRRIEVDLRVEVGFGSCRHCLFYKVSDGTLSSVPVTDRVKTGEHSPFVFHPVGYCRLFQMWSVGFVPCAECVDLQESALSNLGYYTKQEEDAARMDAEYAERMRALGGEGS